MTVTADIARWNYTGNGVLDTYPFTAEIYTATDLKVYVSDVLQVLNVDYTIAVGSIEVPAGGNVVFAAGSIPALDAPISIVLDLPLTQLVDYREGDAFPAETHERALDRLIKIAQTFKEAMKHVAKLPTSSLIDLIFPNPTANNYIGWNAAGDNLENKPLPVATTATQYEVDALISYGGGTEYTKATIDTTLTAVGTINPVTVLLRPGAWNIDADADYSAYDNVIFRIPNGSYFDIDALMTLTLPSSENIIASPQQQIFAGSGVISWADPTGPAYSGWFATLESAQESDIKHLIIEKDWTLAAEVNFDQDDTTIEFIGDAKITGSSNTADVICVSGDNCKILRPYIQGPGTYLQDGTGGKLLEITGKASYVTGGTFIDPPGYGIYCTGDYANITDNHIIGGPAVYSDSVHFGIYLLTSENSSCTKNIIEENAGGFPCIGIGLGSCLYCDISNNTINQVHDVAIYHASTNYNKINNNIVIDPCKGVGGSAIKMDLSDGYNGGQVNDNIVIFGTGTGTGIGLRDPNNIVCTGNYIYGATNDGIVLYRSAPGDITGNNISNNIVDTYGSAGNYLGIGADVSSNVSNFKSNIISNNSILNGSTSNITVGIEVYGAGVAKQYNRFEGNIISVTGSHGIYFGGDAINAGYNVIAHNTITNPGQNAASNGITLDRCLYDEIIGNKIIDDSGTGQMDYGITMANTGAGAINTIKDSSIAGYATQPINYAEIILGEQITVYFGTVAGGDDIEIPIFLAPGPHGAIITDVSLINGADIAAGNPNYETFTVNDRGSDGSAANSIVSFNTNSGGDNKSLADFDKFSFVTDGGKTLDADRILAINDVVTLAKAHAGAGVGTTTMQVVIDYIIY
jgi:parallel beta-helix repeat protein